MTSLIVITFRIGQSVGKASTSVCDNAMQVQCECNAMTRIRRSFNDASQEGSGNCVAGSFGTARVLVHKDGLVHRSGLKVQSGPW